MMPITITALLREMLEAVVLCRGNIECSVSAVSAHSAQVDGRTAFVAIRGTKVDGHQFIHDAISRGAPLVVVEDEGAVGSVQAASSDSTCTIVKVADARRTLSALAAAIAGEPAKQMCTIGVTGTNGKTTINWLIYHLLPSPSLRLGTLGTFAPGIVNDPDTLTSPEATYVHRSLGQAFEGGCRAAVLEASSHALHQHRVSDVRFEVGVFTNLTRDHLDYHRDMEHYYAAKKRLFGLIAENGKPTKAAVVNIDDPYGARLAQDVAREYPQVRLYTTGKAAHAVVRISQFTQSVQHSVLTIAFEGKQFEIASNFIGAHNASNLTQAFAAVVATGVAPKVVAEKLAAAPQVPGRLQRVEGGDKAVFVDYAHTPDALENALTTLRPLVKPQASLWALFGCGGDRDRGKRPQMAAVACRLADKVVVTSDNPRTEDPDTIIRDILADGSTPTIVEADRKVAIEKAVTALQPGDVLLVAGKGHEDCQIIGTTRHHFSDVEVAGEVLRRVIYR